jgi:hypothetical protein
MIGNQPLIMAERERDEHFNTIWLVIPTKQEWRVKEKVIIPSLIASDNDMGVLDDNESPLIKDRSLPPTGVDINMEFMLPVKFRGAREYDAQMCLAPRRSCSRSPKSQANT